MYKNMHGKYGRAKSAFSFKECVKQNFHQNKTMTAMASDFSSSYFTLYYFYLGLVNTFFDQFAIIAFNHTTCNGR